MNFFQFIKGNKILFLTITLTLILLLTYSYVNFTQPKKTTKPTEVVMYTPPDTKADIGKTTDDEIKNREGLKTVTQLPDGSIQYNFLSDLSTRDNLIVTKNGKVIFQRNITLYSYKNQPKISEFTSLYGQPEKIINGSVYYGKTDTYYIYASKGITVIFDSKGEFVDEIHTYTPMSVKDYIGIYGQDIKENPGGTSVEEPL